MFPDFKNSFPEKSFWHFNLHFVLKTFNRDIFQITEKKQRTKNQQLSVKLSKYEFLIFEIGFGPKS